MIKAAAATGAVFLLSLTTTAHASTVQVTGLQVSPAPSADIVFPVGTDPIPASANSGVDPDPDITGPAIIQSVTLATGETVSTLTGPAAIGGIVTVPGGEGPGDTIRNVFAVDRPEVDGTDSLLGLDVSVGVDNAEFIEIFFGAGLLGAAGEGNDIFLFDLFGDDSVFIQGLDADGNVIAGTALEINSGPGPNNFGTDDTGDFGDTGLDLALLLDLNPFGSPDTVIDDVDIAGVGFDVEDLFSGLPFEAVFGLLITGTFVGSGNGSLDLLVAAVNTEAFSEVPVPGAVILFGTGLAGFAAARGRRRKRAF
ncbi:MAG: PEP-CTERM sorting domain-containing protein [Pseudomonadota bacterium]